MTATPAKTTKDVQDVIDNLLVSKLQVRADGDIDVMQYVHSKTVEKIVVKIPPEIMRIVQAIDNEMSKHLRFLCAQNVYFSVEPAKAPEFILMNAQLKFQESVRSAGHEFNKNLLGMVFGAFQQARLLAQGRKILMVHGVAPFVEFCRQKQKDPSLDSAKKKKKDTGKQKNLSRLVESVQFGQMYGLAQKLVDAGIIHPKV